MNHWDKIQPIFRSLNIPLQYQASLPNLFHGSFHGSFPCKPPINSCSPQLSLLDLRRRWSQHQLHPRRGFSQHFLSSHTELSPHGLRNKHWVTGLSHWTESRALRVTHSVSRTQSVPGRQAIAGSHDIQPWHPANAVSPYTDYNTDSLKSEDKHWIRQAKLPSTLE